MRAITVCKAALGALLAAPSLTWARSNSTCASALNVQTTLVHTFSNGTWVENILYHSQRLFASTIRPKAQLYHVDLVTKDVTILGTVPNVTSLLGLAPGPYPDTIVAVGADFDVKTLSGVYGTGSLYLFETAAHNLTLGRDMPPRKVLAVRNATALNGLAAVNTEKGIYVSTDFDAGVIWRLDIFQKTSEIIVANEYTAKTPTGVGASNGLKVRDGYMYWTDDSTKTIARIAINGTGYPVGATEVLATYVEADDLYVEPDGTAYISTPFNNSVSFWQPGDTQAYKLITLDGDATCVTGGRNDSELFVGTAGNYTAYATNPNTTAGFIVNIACY